MQLFEDVTKALDSVTAKHGRCERLLSMSPRTTTPTNSPTTARLGDLLADLQSEVSDAESLLGSCSAAFSIMRQRKSVVHLQGQFSRATAHLAELRACVKTLAMDCVQYVCTSGVCKACVVVCVVTSVSLCAA